MTIQTHDDGTMRSFSTGATRDTGANKLDFDGFLLPEMLEQFAKYMKMNQLQSDGNLRASDNWQKGIPTPICRKSLWRHFFEMWKIMREHTDLETGELEYMGRGDVINLVAAMMGQFFNIQCMLKNLLEEYPMVDFDDDEPTDEMRERQNKINIDSKAEQFMRYMAELPPVPLLSDIARCPGCGEPEGMLHVPGCTVMEQEQQDDIIDLTDPVVGHYSSLEQAIETILHFADSVNSIVLDVNVTEDDEVEVEEMDEEVSCFTCSYENNPCQSMPCRTCLNIERQNGFKNTHWQPKDID